MNEDFKEGKQNVFFLYRDLYHVGILTVCSI